MLFRGTTLKKGRGNNSMTTMVKTQQADTKVHSHIKASEVALKELALVEPSAASNEDIYKLLKTMDSNLRIVHCLAMENRKRFVGVSEGDIMAKFARYDKKGCGEIDVDEFKQALDDLDVVMEHTEFLHLFQHLTAGSDVVSTREFSIAIHEEMEYFEDTQYTIDDLLRHMLFRYSEMNKDIVRGSAPTQSGKKEMRADLWAAYAHCPYQKYPDPDDKHQSFKRACINIFLTFEDEDYSTLSLTIYIVITCLICLSILAFAIQTEPEWESWVGWEILEWTVSIIFTVELGIRLCVCRNPLRFWKRTWYFWDPMIIVDTLAIAPFYISLIWPSSPSAVLRVMRIVRLARLGRLRRFEQVQLNANIIAQAISLSIQKNGTIIATLIVFEVLICSSFVWLAEKGVGVPIKYCGFRKTMEACDDTTLDHNIYVENIFLPTGTNICNWIAGGCAGKYFRSNGLETPFISIPSTMWWTMTTITTVGYGDVAPIERIGQLFGVITMMTGIVAISLCVVIISTNFDEAQRRATQQMKFMRSRQKLLTSKKSGPKKCLCLRKSKEGEVEVEEESEFVESKADRARDSRSDFSRSDTQLEMDLEDMLHSSNSSSEESPTPGQMRTSNSFRSSSKKGMSFNDWTRQRTIGRDDKNNKAGHHSMSPTTPASYDVAPTPVSQRLPATQPPPTPPAAQRWCTIPATEEWRLRNSPSDCPKVHVISTTYDEPAACATALSPVEKTNERIAAIFSAAESGIVILERHSSWDSHISREWGGRASATNGDEPMTEVIDPDPADEQTTPENHDRRY